MREERSCALPPPRGCVRTEPALHFSRTTSAARCRRSRVRSLPLAAIRREGPPPTSRIEARPRSRSRIQSETERGREGERIVNLSRRSARRRTRVTDSPLSSSAVGCQYRLDTRHSGASHSDLLRVVIEGCFVRDGWDRFRRRSLDLLFACVRPSEFYPKGKIDDRERGRTRCLPQSRPR